MFRLNKTSKFEIIQIIKNNKDKVNILIQDKVQSALCESTRDAKIKKHLVGLRPRSKDGMPAIGPIPDWDGLHIVSGHFRSGILLGPISGKIMSDFITTGHGSTFLEYFSPARWTH